MLYWIYEKGGFTVLWSTNDYMDAISYMVWLFNETGKHYQLEDADHNILASVED